MSLTKESSPNNNSLFDTEKTWLQRDFGLDRRLIKALSKLNYIYPTLIQSKCIPIAMQGKDVMVRARTGSGKTVAFALPVLQKILQLKLIASKNGATDETVKAIILAPTKELIKQIEKNVTDMIYYCRDVITICSLIEENNKVMEYRLQSKPDILISTPAKLAQILKQQEQQSSSSSGKKMLLDLQQCNTLVIDEADLILSFGYKQDVNTIIGNLPKIFQGILMSATLSADLDKFKRVILHNPAILKLEEGNGNGNGQDNTSNLLQFYLESTEQDKYLILYVFIKLGLLQGKGLIFVNDVNKCYRLKLFLQQFFISSAVLNCEVPVNSRTHILEEFNRGVFDYLIATDATVDHGDEDDDDEEDEVEGEAEEEFPEDEEEEGDENDNDSDEEDGDDDVEEPEAYNSDDDKEGEEDHDDIEEDVEDESEDEPLSKKAKKESKNADKKKAKKNEKLTEKDDYGVSRGIDFTGVNFVINFDFPQTTAAYTHRIGRTARGVNNGTALSFVTRVDQSNYSAHDAEIARRDREVLDDVRLKQPRLGVVEGDNVLAAIGATGEANDDEARMQPSPLMFNRQELESFRYRVIDTLRSVTGVAVKEFRAAEIRREILNSEKLKSYFAENPNDLKVLRHDKSVLHPIRQKDHLKFVPDYLIPATMKAVANVNGKKKKRKNDRQSQDSRVKRSKMNDPLYGGGKSNADNNTTASNGDSLYGKGNSGRKEWKERHKKGEFNPKLKKRNSAMTPGTFTKAKKKFNR